MSSVYVLEPPTKGKVVMKTTAGALDFELWAKEAPKAVRNFVQLCLEGYYDHTIFHRIIKEFMIQGGDPTGTGTGGDTIYGEPFADEFHSRLRFNHRGLLGCANAGTPNSNNSQFFMTLDRCDWLDKKHTIFGKVTGDTVYNMLKLGEVQTGPDDRPLDPPQIISVEVLWNPFDDIIPRRLGKPSEASEAQPAEASTRRGKKVKKELNLLSFGEEAEEEEQQLLATSQDKKIKSSHDVLEDPRLLKSASDASQMDPAEAKRRKDLQISVRQALRVSETEPGHNASGPKISRALSSPGSEDSDGDEADFDKKMREQIMHKKRMHAGITKPAKKASTEAAVSTLKSGTRSSHDDSKSRNIEDDDLGAKKEKLSIKKGLGSEARAEFAASGDADMQLLTPLEQQRLKYKQRRRTLQGRAESTLGRLKKFTKTMKQASDITSSPAEGMQDDDNDDAGWMAHRLEFPVDPAKQDDMSRNDDPNQYVVHDPLLEKGKEKFNKMQAKMKRRNREWAGHSAT